MNEKQDDTTTPNLKKGNIPIYLTMILLTFLIICLWYGIFEKYNEKDVISNDLNNDNQSNNESPVMLTWNGIYNKEDNSLQLSVYRRGSEVMITNKSDGTLIYICPLIEDYSCEFSYNNESYIVNLTNSNMLISSSSSNQLVGSFIKIEDYILSNYHNDTINNPEHLNSVWNGIFTNGTFTVKILQFDKEKFIVSASDKAGNNIYKDILTINNSQLKIVTDDNRTLTISFNASNLVISGTSDNDGDAEVLLNGTYIKENAYSYDEMVIDGY